MGRRKRTVGKKKVAIVFPTAWDQKHFGAGGAYAGRFEVELKRPLDQECRWDFDVLGFIEEQVASGKGLDGVFSSSDYPGATVAGAIPLILAHGAGSEARENLGIVVFWGVLFSTVLTIYVVPGYYALLARKTGSPGRVAHKLAEQARGREVVPDK